MLCDIGLYPIETNFISMVFPCCKTMRARQSSAFYLVDSMEMIKFAAKYED